MILKGRLVAETPLYRGNARKTLFTRDGDGTHRLVSLAGEISGTAQSLMDAFIGQSRDGRNIGLLNSLWRRLYGQPMPDRLITRVTCGLQEKSYPRGNFFDLRMGIKLDEDRWAVEANANYKMETIFRNSVFDLALTVNDSMLRQNDNRARLYYLLRELTEGRFWFGAGKSKGLGHLRLEMDLPFDAPATPPALDARANHLCITLTFSAANPVLVGWNWGKVDPDVPSFAAVEGQLLVEAMRDIPDPLRDRLAMALAGPILSPDDWKQRLADYLPRVTAVWLMEQSVGETEVWTLPAANLAKLGKGKYGLSKKLLAQLQPLVDKPFASRDVADAAIREALGAKANMARRVLKVMERTRRQVQQLDEDSWQQVSESFDLDAALSEQVAGHIADEAALIALLTEAMQSVLRRLNQQIDQQITLLRSDSWVDAEIANRGEHLRIKTMLRDGQIDEQQWGDRHQVPDGVSPAAWRSFLDEHRRVRYRHMMNPRNLNKSITNDENFIAFLRGYRDRARQELAQPYNVDFRAGGPANREIARKYGKPYDTVFMRMLSWAPSAQEESAWEIYVPGSTLKGAFRKRASQVLKTLWGETAKTNQILDRIFGAQGRRGLVFFSDAYLTDPHDPDRAWCSMDGVKMDPATGRPIEAAKRDYLFAYGNRLVFKLQLDLQDIGPDDLEAFVVLSHLLQDFERGDIALGGQKTSGFGWVNASVAGLTWLTASTEGVHQALFGDRSLQQDGIWQRLDLQGEDAAAALLATAPLAVQQAPAERPPRGQAGFVSHRAFGGYSGTLLVEAELLTPTHIQESGQPSFTAALADGRVNGWDFFSMSPAEAAHRNVEREYALPSRSLRGMLRHIYTIASDSRESASDITRLNPAESLFGWVGQGPNQAIMGRVVIGVGLFEQPELAWFKVPYPYGGWRFAGGQWRDEGGPAAVTRIDKTWRMFPHVPLAPVVQRLDDFVPDTAQASYFRAILPGARARFSIRFWNLEAEELRRLVWCIALEPGLAHRIGKHRYLGLGSLRLRILPESYLIDWEKRYGGEAGADWRLPLSLEEWRKSDDVLHYAALRKALNADSL